MNEDIIKFAQIVERAETRREKTLKLFFADRLNLEPDELPDCDCLLAGVCGLVQRAFRRKHDAGVCRRCAIN